jgi:hypothetical protein
MDTFLTNLYKEERVKQAASDQASLLRSLSVAELEQTIGVGKVAFVGNTDASALDQHTPDDAAKPKEVMPAAAASVPVEADVAAVKEAPAVAAAIQQDMAKTKKAVAGKACPSCPTCTVAEKYKAPLQATPKKTTPPEMPSDKVAAAEFLCMTMRAVDGAPDNIRRQSIKLAAAKLAYGMAEPAGGWEFDKLTDPRAAAMSTGTKTVGAKPSTRDISSGALNRTAGTPPPIPLGHQKTMVSTPEPGASAVPTMKGTPPAPTTRSAISTMKGVPPAPKLAPLTPGAAPAAGGAVPRASARTLSDSAKSFVHGWGHAGRVVNAGNAPSFWARPGKALGALQSTGRSLASRAGSAARMIAPHAGLVGAGLLGAKMLFGGNQKQAGYDHENG